MEKQATHLIRLQRLNCKQAPEHAMRFIYIYVGADRAQFSAR